MVYTYFIEAKVYISSLSAHSPGIYSGTKCGGLSKKEQKAPTSRAPDDQQGQSLERIGQS